MNSAVYEGRLRHRVVRPLVHESAYDVAMPYLDLAELDRVFARHPLWSVGRRNAVSFRRSDFLGDPDVPLDTAVRDLVEQRTGERPTGPIGLLAHVRTWGWLFSPLSIYFCFDREGRRVAATVLEVSDTPWGERHTYVLARGTGKHRFPKELHVSPFPGTDQEYLVRITEPGTGLVVRLVSLEDGEVVFHALLSLRRREVDRRSLGGLLWRHPLHALRVSAGTCWRALRLRAGRALPRGSRGRGDPASVAGGRA